MVETSENQIYALNGKCELKVRKSQVETYCIRHAACDWALLHTNCMKLKATKWKIQFS